MFLTKAPAAPLIYQFEYDVALILLSIGIAIFSIFVSLVALKNGDQLNNKNSRILQNVMAVLTMGVGVWAMHFTGMISFKLPCSANYHGFLTLFSIAPSLLASWAFLSFVKLRQKNIKVIFLTTFALGFGIGGMHLIGMSAMRIPGYILYSPIFFYYLSAYS